MERAIYIAMRRDLNMRRGKEIAQACHAILDLETEDMAVVCIRAESEDHLMKMVTDARTKGHKAVTVTDAGRTEFGGVPTLTCAAIGPMPRDAVPSIAAAVLY